MGEQGHKGGSNSNRRKLPDRVEQYEAKSPKTILKQARERIDEVEKWSGSGELSLLGKAGEWMDHINKETAKWNAAISNIGRPEDAELLYDASVRFATLAQVNPEDPQALAEAADAAYTYFGRLLEKTKTPIVSDIGQLLETARHLFEFGREAFDPIRRPPYRTQQHIIRRADRGTS
jgi:hypothetical protein